MPCSMGVDLSQFTFHFDSIKTGMKLMGKKVYDAFTFHFDSIKTVPRNMTGYHHILIYISL